MIRSRSVTFNHTSEYKCSRLRALLASQKSNKGEAMITGQASKATHLDELGIHYARATAALLRASL